jgi:hypothetical protein
VPHKSLARPWRQSLDANFCGHNKFQVKRHISTQCIYKVDRLLPINLLRNSRDGGLKVEDNLED